ncbi:MAG TPA: GNAT family N-acetyltransferase [Mycobacterium sp.]
MTEDDLPTVAAWLAEPHVARWWTPDTTAEAQISKYRERVNGSGATTMLMASVEGRPVGWCQWYRWADYPAAAQAMQARDGEAGIDYAIGDPTAVGHGIGTELVAALVHEVRRCTGPVGLLVAPDATNSASRRVLEKNAFMLVSIRPVATELSQAPMAIHRLAP